MAGHEPFRATPKRTSPYLGPSESPIRIEYASALLREVRMAGALIDSFGVLYGVRHGATIRLVSTRGRAGLDPVGIFASRVRGPRFSHRGRSGTFRRVQGQASYMVISGDTGGFFVRDAAEIHGNRPQLIRNFPGRARFRFHMAKPVIKNAAGTGPQVLCCCHFCISSLTNQRPLWR